MRTLEKAGRNVTEALAAALEEMGVPSDRVSVQVLDEGKSGFLGIGSKPAVVRVTLRESRRDRIERFLSDIRDTVNLDINIDIHENGEYLSVEIAGDGAGMLIGHHGQTLDALQYLLNLVAARVEEEGPRVLLDIEGYRKRREETLTRLATRLAEKVQRTGEPMALEPMTAHERRIIHLTLQESSSVITSSEGEEPFRRVVIQPKR